MNHKITQERLKLLRNEMKQHNIDVYLIPSTDAHNSEYVPKCWERRPWISNFDGSAGEVIVTLDHAYLWTDGRYFLQAEQQLDPLSYTLMKQTSFAPETEEWLQKNAKGKILAVDPQTVSINRAQNLQALMQNISGKLINLNENLIDTCKLKLGEKLDLPRNQAYHLADEYTGKNLTNKLEWLRKNLSSHNAEFIILNALDEIAWLFNIRGSDISYNPLVISYSIIGLNEVKLFIEDCQITQELASFFKDNDVKTYNYSDFSEHLAKIRGSIWIDDKVANYWMFDLINDNNEIIFNKSPIIFEKASKNQAEISGTKYAHIKDAVAVINFLSWLDNNWKNGVDELSCVDKLHSFRINQPNFVGESFATISGFGSNGAIIHYRVTDKTNKKIDDSNLFLLDSGGQYTEGTTDITRTIHLGNPTEEQKLHYTLVLKGHLALGRAKFPKGTRGEHLDAFARSYLWSNHLDYRHGTGHGVGSFLCVHEGPQKISQAISTVALIPGMIVSNEPGVYIDGSHGIRIENLCLVTEDLSKQNSGFGPFYQFENLTLIPYAKKLIKLELLTQEEKNQIDTYYAQIKRKVKNLLNPKEQEWLEQEMNIFE